jgi:hypothetical protein
MAPLFALARRTPTAAGSGAADRANDDELPLAEDAEERVETAGGGDYSGGHGNYADVQGRRRKLRDTPGSKSIVVPTKGELVVYKGTKATEDERWVYITEVKDNGTKAYLCRQCLRSFTGYEAKIISHCLQLNDGLVASCAYAPSAECRVVLERAKAAKDKASARGGRVGSSSLSKDLAVGSTPPVAASLGGGVNRIEECDEALAKWAVAHDISWSAIDSRDKLWVAFIDKLKLAGPSYRVPQAEVMSCAESRGGRAGGLHLALKSKDNEKEAILAAAVRLPALTLSYPILSHPLPPFPRWQATLPPHACSNGPH